MIGLIQRVSTAKVVINTQTVGEIAQGMLVLVGVEPTDTEAHVERLLERLLNYRIFADDQGKMNLSLQVIQGGLLLVPQFTLAADTRKGLRPSFTSAAPPELGLQIFQSLCQQAHQKYAHVAEGIFGADMQVHLINDGPVTFWLKI
jgi:D-tyrosyl-tRNA(Tyr) deacylase